MSGEYYYDFECSPEQYHASIDKLWKALAVEGQQKDECFTMAANEITRLRNRVKELEALKPDIEKVRAFGVMIGEIEYPEMATDDGDILICDVHRHMLAIVTLCKEFQS